MPELLRLILTRATTLVGVEDGYLYLVQPDGESLVVVAGLGAFEERFQEELRRGAATTCRSRSSSATAMG